VKGVLIEKDSGLTYTGEFENDLKNGTGTLSSTSMDYVYDGQWFDNLRHGIGQLVTPEYKYSGGFKQNQFHGNGVY